MVKIDKEGHYIMTLYNDNLSKIDFNFKYLCTQFRAI